MKLLLLPSLRSYLHIFHNYQGCWHENQKQTQLTKYHHESGDAEEEYTFIVDLSSRSQRAQCWCRCTTARLARQSGWRGLSGKAQPRFAQTTPSGRRGLLVWSLPSLCCRKRVKCTFARASNTAVRSRQDQSSSTELRFCIRTWCTKASSVTISVLVVSAWELHCLSGEWESWVFLCLFSACVTAKVQTICGSYFSFSSQQGAVRE